MTVLVLAIDTSTPVITAGVVSVKRPHELSEQMAAGAADPTPVRVLVERTVTHAFGHAEHLMPLITEALHETGHTVREVEAVVVGIGPGPFTGLRVGMATAAALGDGLGIPVHGVPSHDALARAACDGDGDFLVVTDARRKEVYATAYAASGELAHGPDIVAPTALADWCAARGLAPQWITGAGAELAAGLALPVRPPARTLSEGLISCAMRALVTGAVPGPLSPLYLRRPDATEPHAPKPVLPAAGQ
jgi:tRNA threonylcarbamoyl adenosine modification protein YeaZ